MTPSTCRLVVVGARHRRSQTDAAAPVLVLLMMMMMLLLMLMVVITRRSPRKWGGRAMMPRAVGVTLGRDSLSDRSLVTHVSDPDRFAVPSGAALLAIAGHLNRTMTSLLTVMMTMPVPLAASALLIATTTTMLMRTRRMLRTMRPCSHCACRRSGVPVVHQRPQLMLRLWRTSRRTSMRR